MVYNKRKEKAKGMNEFDYLLKKNVTDPMKYQPDVTATNPWFSEDGFLIEDNNKYKTEAVPESHPSVPHNNTYRAYANHEYRPRIQHKMNIPEVPTPSRTVFTLEQNELFVQHVVQDAQGLEVEALYYHIIGLNEYATEDDLKNPIVN